MDDTPQMDRRTFLARIGVLGAFGTAGALSPGLLKRATAAADTLGPQSLLGDIDDLLLDIVREILAEVARDTHNGLTTFVVPGPDAYSQAQGTPRSEPGAMEARAPDFLMNALDNYVAAPDQLVTPIARALADGLADVPVTEPVGIPLPPLVPLPVDTLDEAVRHVLRNDDTLPLSVVMALLLNTVATQVNPASVSGLFLSPFSRLSFADKAKVFEQIERPNAQLVASLDASLPAPLTGSASGLLQFVGGALLEFSAFGSYCEWATFDKDVGFVTSRPVGWDLAGYEVGVVDGWDEFAGYYQDRREVEPA